MTFSRYRKNEAEEDSTLGFPQLGFPDVKKKKTTTYSDCTCHLDVILRSLLFLDSEMSMQCCAICSVASTRGLKRISIAIPPSSSEVSTAVEKATQKAV